MPPPALFDLATVDCDRVLYDTEQIRAVNKQRFELEQLTAIVLLDQENRLVAGYRDVRPDEFWVRGHFPDFPLFPGVLMCEAAAQMCSFYVSVCKLMEAELM